MVNSQLHRITVIGTEDQVLPFRSLGCNVSTENNKDLILTKIKQYITENHTVFLINDSYLKLIENNLNELTKDTNSVIVALPDDTGSTHNMFKLISGYISKAVGFTIDT